MRPISYRLQNKARGEIKEFPSNENAREYKNKNRGWEWAGSVYEVTKPEEVIQKFQHLVSDSIKLKVRLLAKAQVNKTGSSAGKLSVGNASRNELKGYLKESFEKGKMGPERDEKLVLSSFYRQLHCYSGLSEKDFVDTFSPQIGRDHMLIKNLLQRHTRKELLNALELLFSEGKNNGLNWISSKDSAFKILSKPNYSLKIKQALKENEHLGAQDSWEVAVETRAVRY
ncbi:MAG: hypothetical protein IPK68_22650 [Bdellovibrionales bacterium]|nr:hypothetical protein [Bdellovibrionales bacterium]